MTVENRFRFSGPKSLLDKVLDLAYFHPTPDSEEIAIPVHRVNGKGKLIVVVGDNASGKSFFRRLVSLWCHKNKTECIAISAEARRNISYRPWMTLVYGDEQHESTGVNSTDTVLGAIKSSRGRDKGKHVIFWDEPDLGMGRSWAAGIGKAIAEFAAKPPKRCKAIIVVSHSVHLLSELVDLRPYYLHLGKPPEEAPQTLTDWIEQPILPCDPETFKAASVKRFRLIQAHIDRYKIPWGWV